MSSSPSRSPLLLPYVMPSQDVALAPSSGTSAAAYTPFVPPTWVTASASDNDVAPRERSGVSFLEDAPAEEPSEPALGLDDETAHEAVADNVHEAANALGQDAARDAALEAAHDASDDVFPEASHGAGEEQISDSRDNYDALTIAAEQDAEADVELSWIEAYMSTSDDESGDAAGESEAPLEVEAALASDAEPEVELEADLEAEPQAELETERAPEPEAELETASDAECEAGPELAVDSEQPSREGEDGAPWPIEDATDEVARLAEGLTPVDSGAAARIEAAALFAEPAETLGPWQDDEAWMDIMPALPNTGAGDLAAQSDWARAFAEAPAPMLPPPLPRGDAQAAAASLESVAQRLRSGELGVPGFSADRGDAAALAAALSALLGAQG